MLELEIKFVEQAKELAVLDPMMGVQQKLLCALSGDIASVQHTSLEILSVDLALIMVPWIWEQQRIRVMENKFVDLAKEPAVLDQMMGVLQKLLYALNGDIVSVLHTNLEIQSVALALIIMEELVQEVDQEEQQLEVLKQKLVVVKQKEQKLKKQGHLEMEEQVEKQEELKQLQKK